MRLTLSTFVFMASFGIAVAQVPQFDPGPGCRAGADSGASVRKDVDSCIKSERAARDQLVRQCDAFAATDRARCASQTQAGGPPSYIEVLTCLEMARDARTLPKDNTGLDVGQRPR